MTFAPADLVLMSHGNGKKIFYHDAANSSDTMATVAAAGYYNNTDDMIGMAVKDLIIVNASDGNFMLEVASISSGAVTTQYYAGSGQVYAAGANSSVTLPNNGVVTLTPTTASTGYTIANPVPGVAVDLVMTNTNTSASAVIQGAVTSVIEFSGDSNNTLTLVDNATSRLIGVSTTRYVLTNRSTVIGTLSN